MEITTHNVTQVHVGDLVELGVAQSNGLKYGMIVTFLEADEEGLWFDVARGKKHNPDEEFDDWHDSDTVYYLPWEELDSVEPFG